MGSGFDRVKFRRNFDIAASDSERRCAAGGCGRPVATFRQFPTVAGYCLTHGNVLANFLSLLDAPGDVGFDAARARWERVLPRGGRPSSG